MNTPAPETDAKIEVSNVKIARLFRILGILKRLFLIVATCYALSLIALPIVFSWIGERNLTLAFLLFLPRTIVLLPLPFILLPSFFLSKWQSLLLVSASLIFIYFGMGYRIGASQESKFSESKTTNELSILTYNRGQHGGKSLQPFKNLILPDILVLQEAENRAQGYLDAPAYSEFSFGKNLDEHTIVSKFPITKASTVHSSAGGHEQIIAVRAELDFHGKPIVLYSVHLNTPRDTLRYYMRGAFLYGIIGLPSFSPYHERYQQNQVVWNDQIQRAKDLISHIEGEVLPTIVVGDFNSPSGGFVHRLFRAELNDSHLEAGNGFGYSFPGTTRNPLSLGGPWMRIDYIFSKGWHTEASVVEKSRPSQHRAVAARLRLK